MIQCYFNLEEKLLEESTMKTVDEKYNFVRKTMMARGKEY
jgi:hypothetical protein